MDRRRGIADDRAAGGRIDQTPDTTRAHRLHQAEAADHVDVEIESRIGNRFDDTGVRCQVDHRIDSVERDVERGRIADVAMDEFPGKVVEMVAVPKDFVVEHPHLPARSGQPRNQICADEAATAGDEDPHRPNIDMMVERWRTICPSITVSNPPGTMTPLSASTTAISCAPPLRTISGTGTEKRQSL